VTQHYGAVLPTPKHTKGVKVKLSQVTLM